MEQPDQVAVSFDRTVSVSREAKFRLECARGPQILTWLLGQVREDPT